MKIFEFEFTIEELIDIVNLIQNLKNIEEKHLCLLLYLSTELLQDWYNEINKIFSPVLDKKGIRNLTNDERNESMNLQDNLSRTNSYDSTQTPR